MWRAIASNALTLFVVVLALVAGLLAWGRQQWSGTGPLAQPICFRVEQGDSLSKVSRALEARGAVSDARIFRIGADYAKAGDNLKFGSYVLPSGATMGQVLEALTGGRQTACGPVANLRIGVASVDVVLGETDLATRQFVETARFEPGAGPAPAEYREAANRPDLRWQVTLAEGVTSWQVVEGLKKADFLTGDVAVPPEGALAPQAYDVAKGSTRGDLIARMQANQTRVLTDLWAARADGLPYDTPEQALVMASIVEKETGVPDERPQVASVFVNRLRAGMKLQTDPTVIYGITKGQGVLGRGLRQSELRANTKWNTYVIDGLPPTPIANPGRDAIAAALNPAATDYLYFVADGSGGHVFAATLAEHNQNVVKWRAIEAQQGQPNVGGVQGD